jgi:dienelactone hydrolase
MSAAERIVISVGSERTSGVLHPSVDAVSSGAVLMVAGASGGLLGPAGIYHDLATQVAQDGIAALRLEYRRPNHLGDCIADVREAIAELGRRGGARIVLIGWSFGGAVVIAAGVQSEAVVGVVTIASQTYGTASIRFLAPKPLLLVHGTRDTVLSDICSRMLYAEAREPKELVLYAGDGHHIECHRAELLAKLHTWSRTVLAVAQPPAS